MESTEPSPERIAEIERELKAADAALAASGSITRDACLMEVAEVAGGFRISHDFKTDVEWIRGTVGGFLLGGSVVWGKLTINESINRAGYSGSCAVAKVALLGAYTHVTGFDQDSNAVFKFDGGGYGIGVFFGGGTFEIKEQVT